MATAIVIIIICMGGLRLVFKEMEYREEQKRKKQHWQRTGRRLKSK